MVELKITLSSKDTVTSKPITPNNSPVTGCKIGLATVIPMGNGGVEYT